MNKIIVMNKIIALSLLVIFSINASIKEIKNLTKRTSGQKRYDRKYYKQNKAMRKHKNNKKNLFNYLSLLIIGIYAGEEALSLYKKLEKENSVEGIMESKCTERYINLIAERIKPYIIRSLEEKSYKLNDALIKKKIFRGIKNNIVLPHPTIETTLLVPRKYPKTVLNETLDNNLVKNGEFLLSEYVTTPLLKQVLLNQAAM